MSKRSGHSSEYDVGETETFELASLLPDADGDEAQSRIQVRSPLPKLQVLVVLVLHLAAPVCTTLTAPFLVELIAGLNIPSDEVGYYFGILNSLSYAGEGLSVWSWGLLSDKFGRRPVLLVCSFGLALTLVTFGLSTTFTGLAISRLSEGLLNGVSGTIKAILAELANGDEDHLADVFSLMPMIWAVGATIGPILGGSLANPAERYPGVFNSILWVEHPYLLACFSGVFFRIAGFFIVLFCLKETLSSAPPSKHDEILLQNNTDLEEPLLSSHPHHIPASSWYPRHSSSFVTRRLFVTLANYAALGFLDASLYATYNLLLASPISSGGLGFPPEIIGYIIGVSSVCHGLVQAFCFARILKRYDARNVHAVSIIGYIFLYIMMPVTHYVAQRAGRVTLVVWGLIILEGAAFFASYSAYSCIYIFMSQASPSQSALGKTHGLGQTVHSTVAAVAPAVATSIVAASLQHNLLGGALGYLVLAGVGVIALGLNSLLPATKRVPSVNTNIELD